MEYKDHKVQLEILAHKVIPDHKVHVAHKVRKVILDQAVVHKVHKDRKV